ncbi:hypothetical protein ACIA8O_18805 [Kitasatospora sp. NPDC051853]|uniref:hypothetical protein n=1 Tax=Kitasatospora sp. NPDC051853 TaxID=3364058 RepID=UPI00379B99E4
MRGRRTGIDTVTQENIRYLLTLAPVEVRSGVCARLGIEPGGVLAGAVHLHGDAEHRPLLFAGLVPLLPRAAGWWMLREDIPEVNRQLLSHGWLPPGLAADVRDGMPFGPGTVGSVPVLPARYGVWAPAPAPLAPADELIAQLRAAVGPKRLRSARSAAGQLRYSDWPLVAEADAAEPLPGFARWALAERIDCPAELRAAFGSHPKFEHRLRQATTAVECRELLDRSGLVRATLRILDLGRWAFPTALAPVEEALRPLVARHLADRPEAWVVLARLLPTYRGTVGALLAEAGAARPGEEAVLPPATPRTAAGERAADPAAALRTASARAAAAPDSPLAEHRRRMAERRARGELPGPSGSGTTDREAAPPPGRGGWLGWLRGSR